MQCRSLNTKWCSSWSATYTSMAGKSCLLCRSSVYTTSWHASPSPQSRSLPGGQLWHLLVQDGRLSNNGWRREVLLDADVLRRHLQGSYNAEYCLTCHCHRSALYFGSIHSILLQASSSRLPHVPYAAMQILHLIAESRGSLPDRQPHTRCGLAAPPQALECQLGSPWSPHLVPEAAAKGAFLKVSLTGFFGSFLVMC